MPVNRTPTFTIRFTGKDLVEKEEFYDRLDASGSENKSAFAMQLLSQALSPADPIQGATIQALLRDVKDASDGIQSDLQDLKLKNNQSRHALANAVAVLLFEIGGSTKESKEKAKRWVNKHMPP
jgi:hypothetical protein